MIHQAPIVRYFTHRAEGIGDSSTKGDKPTADCASASIKYGQACLAAFAYRFNRRFDLRGLLATLIVDVARCMPVPEKVVRRGHAEAAF